MRRVAVFDSPRLAPDWQFSAEAFLAGLPQSHEGPERALAFRWLVAAAATSEEHRRLLCGVYELIAERDVVAYSLHDAQMFVAAVTEHLDLLPLLEDAVERFLARHEEQEQIRGLWTYVREIYELRRTREPIGCLVRRGNG